MENTIGPDEFSQIQTRIKTVLGAAPKINVSTRPFAGFLP